MWPFRRPRQRPKTRAEVLTSIRASLAFFGHSTEGLTDEELEEGLIEAGRTIARLGFTAEEFGRAIQSAKTGV